MTNPATPGTDPAAIPTLMEPVAAGDAPILSGDARRDVSVRGREHQQALFADLEPAPEKPVRKPAPTPAERLRAAREMLRARAPAIVEEVAAAHQQQLHAALRQRLQQELAQLLADLGGPDAPP